LPVTIPPGNTVHALYAWGRPPRHVCAACWRCLLTYLLTIPPGSIGQRAPEITAGNLQPASCRRIKYVNNIIKKGRQSERSLACLLPDRVRPYYRARGERVCAEQRAATSDIELPIFLESAYNTSKHRKITMQRNLRPSRPGGNKTIRGTEVPERLDASRRSPIPTRTSCHPCKRFECCGTLMGTLYHA
jgi:hypothetical protein